MSDISESLDRREPDREPTVGDAVRVLEAQLAFWRRTAFLFGGGLVLATIVILIGLGALLSIASTSAESSKDSERAAVAAEAASKSNAEALEIIKDQTGPEARQRSANSITAIRIGINCDFRRAAIEAGLNVPEDYLNSCADFPPPSLPTTSTTTPTEE